MSIKEKLEALMEAIINGSNEEAEKLFHEALTEKARQIIEGDDEDDENGDDEEENGDDDDSDDEEDDSDDSDSDDDDEDDDDEDEDDDDEESDEEEELTRKGRRTDKASKGRTRKK